VAFTRVRTGGYSRVYTTETIGAGGVTLPITEPWDSASDATGLTGDYSWTAVNAGWAVSSHKARLSVSGGATRIERLGPSVQTNDFRVRVPVVTFPTDRAGTQIAGVCCRMPSDGTLTFYTAYLACQDAGPVTLNLARWINGLATPLGSAITLTGFTLPNDLAVSAKGSQIAAWWAGRRRNLQTDVLIPSGSFGGVQGFTSTSGVNIVEYGDAIFEVVPAIVRRVTGLAGLGGLR